MKTNNANASLELAKRLSETVNDAWESGELMVQETPTTQELLKFWFSEEHCSMKTGVATARNCGRRRVGRGGEPGANTPSCGPRCGCGARL